MRARAGSFWSGPFVWMVGIGLGAVAGFALFYGEGLPRDHDAYGSVPIPGQVRVALPEGDVFVNYENDPWPANTSVIPRPPRGTAVGVTSAATGEALALEDPPSWSYYKGGGVERGWERYATVAVPAEGEYVVRTVDSASGGFEAPPARDAIASGKGPEITLGKRFWKPLDSALLGALLTTGVGALIAFGVRRLIG